MTLNTLRWSAAVQPDRLTLGFEALLMALRAGHVPVGHIQGEAGALVIECDLLPLDRAVARVAVFHGAIAPKLGGVDVGGPVA
jgi:hypothetical protein